jgi:spore maturation protein CgeB
MPSACCQVSFSAQPSNAFAQPEFDVAFVGSRIRSRNPLGHFYWVTRRRVEFVRAFTKRYGRRFGLFGKGWEGNRSWQGPVPYAGQNDAYRRSAVALGGMPHGYHDYYTSDRPFIAAASGVPLVDYWIPGVERILKPGRDWWLARNQQEMFGLCDRLLEMPNSERLRCGQEARESILAHHTQYQRCREMIEIAKSVREARLSGRRAPEPKLGFLSHSSVAASPPDSVVAWQG